MVLMHWLFGIGKGPVREVRETAQNRFQKFVEFYDVRDAARAMAALNGKQIFGRNAVIEFSRPGGQCKRLWNTHSSSRNSSKCLPHRPRPPPPPPEVKPSIRPAPPPPPPRWRGGSDGSKSSSSGSSLHGSVSNLCISGYEECSRRHKKTSSSKKGNCATSSSGGASVKSSHGGSWPWKGGGGGSRRGKDDRDPRFLINEDTIVESNSRDPRTTVMIKNIPNKYRYFFFYFNICLSFLFLWPKYSPNSKHSAFKVQTVIN